MAVLVSGAGTNLGALLDASAVEGYPAEVRLVVGNRPSAGALRVAAERGVEARALPVSAYGGDLERRDAAMRDLLLAAGVRLVVCAGYDRVLSDVLLLAFPDAVMNIHPSLLPAFGGGMNAVRDAFEHGVKVTGCTVHLLECGDVDGGAIVVQEAVAVEEDDTVETLTQRVHEAEWRALPRAVRLWCEGRVRREGRRVRVVPAGGAPPVGDASGWSVRGA